MSPPTLRFVLGHRPHALPDVAADRTLLDVLREDLRCTAVKEGCASGDCGACTVAVAEAEEGGRLHWRAVNSCIRLAHSVEGMAVFTAEDIAGEGGRLHPAQRAMLECHGSQCGFCTPGFVMSLFTLHRQRDGAAVSRGDALHALSGNLCRCTGYRPILDAAQTMHHWPDVPLDESGLLQQLKLLAQDGRAPVADSASNFYATPTTLSELLRLRAAHPQALIAAGTTDVGLWVTKQHRRFGQIIDVTRVTELRRIERGAHSLSIGAAASLTEAFDALAECRPQLKPFFDRFAGLPVRESGTLGGNVANGSPIGDSMPLLIALGATLVLASTRGERTLPIEDFYLAYRKTALAPDEVLARIEVPQPTPHEWLRADKISKRFEDDISAVCLAVALQVEDGVIHSARIGAGGVAAVPARAMQTEAALAGQPCAEAIFDAAATVLEAEFKPLSDMRASSAYRRAVLGNLLRRGWQQSQPGALALADLTMEPLP
ncbi:MAG TPA: xanthine dehydrogenase small subunit [Ottowia sp.]|uniref:xanthine dehydrogenase small subunit n=1 Tax=Ottowia sp. TaxID=1898956 RepID=UPI002BA96CF3|nr:xanthine dehydrogenase small subunit [Ottowia sp.]HRN05931.1 xanthine dehydrogenase small subunit [Ottowia sp.]